MKNREHGHNPEDELNTHYLLRSIEEWKNLLTSIDKKLDNSSQAHEAMFDYIRQADEELGNLQHYMERLHPSDPSYEFKKEFLINNRQKFIDHLERARQNLEQASEEYQDEASEEMQEVVEVKSKIAQMLMKMKN